MGQHACLHSALELADRLRADWREKVYEIAVGILKDQRDAVIVPC